MLKGDYTDELTEYVLNENIGGANEVLMKKLGEVLINNKKDFIDLLNENGIEADISMSHSQLIELFIDNTDDKDLLIGASLLIGLNNKRIGFDGEDHISDEKVKTGVAVMDSYFNEVVPDEDYSYIAPFLIGMLAKGAHKLVNKRRGTRSKKTSNDYYRKLAEYKMKQEALYRQKLKLEKKKRQAELDKKTRRRNNIIIIASSITVALIVGIIIYKKRNT